MANVSERVRALVAEHMSVELDRVGEDTRFVDDLGVDSLDSVEIVIAFEDEFQVEIPDDAAAKLVTVGEAIAYISAISAEAA